MANVLPLDRQAVVIAHLIDGCGVRATERLTGADKNTVMRLALLVGEGCLRLHDRLFRNLKCSIVQLDEQWSYCFKKQGHLKTTDPVDTMGDQWTFLALDVASRAAVSWLIGKRSAENCKAFALDVRRRVEGAPFIYSDGFQPYIDALEQAFGLELRYGQLVKEYEERPSGRDGRYVGAERTVIRGKMEPQGISTSYIERANLSARQESRRLGRQTLGHSKSLRHHTASLGLFYAAYNLTRIHTSLRVTPAMACGVEKKVWSVADLVEAALAEPMPAPPPPVEPEKPKQSPFQMLLPGMKPGLSVVRGGR